MLSLNIVTVSSSARRVLKDENVAIIYSRFARVNNSNRIVHHIAGVDLLKRLLIKISNLSRLIIVV